MRLAVAQREETELEDLLEISRLVRDCLLAVTQQHKGKKLRLSLLRSMVANKVKDLSDNHYTLKTILGCYDRLNSEDARISALINSICGVEPSVCQLSHLCPAATFLLVTFTTSTARWDWGLSLL